MKIQFIFNDSNPTNVKKLSKEINNTQGIEKLRFKPIIENREIGEKTIKDFEDISIVPTLSFIDPWGYKGLSLQLVKALAKGWGCESIFFLNYTRINPGIENKALKRPISLLFTKEVLDELREAIHGKSPSEREKIILFKIKDVFIEWGMQYVLPFPFKSKSGKRTTHYLIFVSKNILGYDILKGIMGTASSSNNQGVPSFEYNPFEAMQPRLLFLEKPMDKLKEMLISDFAGSTSTMKEIYNRHHIDKPYLEKNYREALLSLENVQKIKTNRASRIPKHRAGTFPDNMKVIFPNK